MRDEELRFSQALKDRLSGVGLSGAFGDKGETMLIEIPSPDDTTVEVISQFGTARESTLAMLRGMAPETWDDREHGPTTVREATEDLLAQRRRPSGEDRHPARVAVGELTTTALDPAGIDAGWDDVVSCPVAPPA